MSEFAGWSMPIVYANHSHIESHLHTREHASLFDVSHMLQLKVGGQDRLRFLESLVVGDLSSLAENQTLLSLFTNEQGGIKDDALITRERHHFRIVSNAIYASKMLAYLKRQLDMFRLTSRYTDVYVDPLVDHSLLALQGPKSSIVLSKLIDDNLDTIGFMESRVVRLLPRTLDSLAPIRLTRCGYTGEDGFEMDIQSTDVLPLANYLLTQFNETVRLAGLASRDSLRLEAGLCLSGQDIDEEVSPVEAGLAWCIGKQRRHLSNTGSPATSSLNPDDHPRFPGFNTLLRQLADPSTIRKRLCGFEILEGAPARSHVTITNRQGNSIIGQITSGMPSPSLKKNIAIGYINSPHSYHPGTEVSVLVRGVAQKARIVKLPFIDTHYYRKRADQ
jgi:aminomethyltransferase